MGKHALVIGAGGGIGSALVAALCHRDDITSVATTRRSAYTATHPKCTSHILDLLDEATIANVARQIPPPHLVIVATGMLHDDGIEPEKSWRAISAEAMARSYAINCIGPALLAKHILPLMPRTEKVVFAALASRVGSIEDNRSGGWHSYRASKAALNQLLRTLSIEAAMKYDQAIIVGLHPGTVATALSAPFAKNISTNKLFSPTQSATHLLEVIDALTPADSGRVVAWDGQVIPY